jgi:hypothetical protein
VGVRLLAATHAFAWARDEAIPTLAAIEASGGLLAVTAKWTRREYERAPSTSTGNSRMGLW